MAFGRGGVWRQGQLGGYISMCVGTIGDDYRFANFPNCTRSTSELEMSRISVLLFLAVAISAAVSVYTFPSQSHPPVVHPLDENVKCGQNEVFKVCGACERECDIPENIFCPTVCFTGCQCKHGYWRNSDGECVLRRHCS